MNSKLMKAALAGTAAIALAAGGGTFAAFSDFGNITGNTVGAGILKLDVTPNSGGTTQSLNWGSLAPNNLHSQRMVWVASNDGASVPDANLSITFQNLTDSENGCASNGETAADATCATAGDPGELSKVVTFQTQYYPGITNPATCSDPNSYPGGAVSIWPSDHPGDLYDVVHNLQFESGPTYQLKNAANTGPLVLAPGHGVCLGIDTWWAPNDAAVAWGGPVDNAAQGDSLSFDIHLDLTQAV